MITSLMAAATKVVNKEEELGEYNSIIQTISSLCAMVAPLIGAGVFNLLSVTTFVIIEVIVESICVIYIYNIKLVSEIKLEEEAESDIKFKQLVTYIKGKQLVVLFAFCMIFINLVMGAINVGYPFILSSNFSEKPIFIGLINFSIPFGLLAGSILYQILKPKGTLEKTILNSWSGFGLIMLAIGLFIKFLDIRSYLFVVTLIISSFLVGILITYGRIPLMSYIQKEVKGNVQGRVFSVIDAFVKSTIPVSWLLYGFLFDTIDKSMIYMVSGLLLLVYMLFIRFIVNKQEHTPVEQ